MYICFCEEFRKKFDISKNCCNSCHQDFDEGYSDLCEIEIDHVIYQVCCSIDLQYKEKQKDNKGEG